MKCPVCGAPDLVMAERQGIEIDYCPQCRGVWLDRGELDKLIDRSATAAGMPPGAEPLRDSYRYETGHHHDAGYHGGHHKRKRGGFLEEIFDFD
jgi:Zn-finger nucleic acid-binding protein